MKSYFKKHLLYQRSVYYKLSIYLRSVCKRNYCFNVFYPKERSYYLNRSCWIICSHFVIQNRLNNNFLRVVLMSNKSIVINKLNIRVLFFVQKCMLIVFERHFNLVVVFCLTFLQLFILLSNVY